MAKINTINNNSGELTINPGASGDSFIQFDINGTGEFRIGVDDNDSDKFKISQGSTLGSNDTFTITASGERTMPLQSAVHAYLNTEASNITGDGTTWTCALESERFDQNGDYNTSTYTFIAPVTGRYLVTAFLEFKGLTSSHTTGLLECVTSNRTYLFDYLNSYAAGHGNSVITHHGVCFADMDASDTLTIECTISGGTKVVDAYGITGSVERTNLCVYLVC